jgi:hypothetical protein
LSYYVHFFVFNNECAMWERCQKKMTYTYTMHTHIVSFVSMFTE